MSDWFNRIAMFGGPTELSRAVPTDSGVVDTSGYNPAKDSQMANATLGLAPVTTDDTIPDAPTGATRMVAAVPRMGGQKPKAPLVQAVIVAQPTLAERERALEVQNPNLVTSSRAKKTPVAVPLSAVARAGATGQDQVSQNGVHIGAIRALDKQIAQLEAAARKKGLKV